MAGVAYGHVGIAIRTPDELESKLAQALAEKSGWCSST